MRSAPAVAVQGTGGPLWRAWSAVLPAAALGAVVAWAFGHLARAELGALVGLVLGSALGLWRWRRRPPTPVVLSWDGRRWSADGVEGTLSVMLDLGTWMLVRLCGAEGSAARWVAIDRTEAGPAWHALRVAAFAPSPPPGRAIRSDAPHG